eukprot:gene26323-17418_t
MASNDGMAKLESVTSPSDGLASALPGPSAAADAAPIIAEKKKKKEYKQVTLPSGEMMATEDVLNNCVVKTTVSAVMGGLAGIAFGVFTASIENSGMDGHVDLAPKTTRVVLKEMWTNMKMKSVSYAKGFAYFGAVYSFNECVIEKARAKHDIYNPALAGCATGAIMAWGAPLVGLLTIGCTSVRASSIVIEHFLER